MAASDWELGSGFAWDGATGTIGDVEFTHDARLGDNAVCKMTFTDCVDANGDAMEDFEQFFTVSKNYDSNKDGTALEGTGKINENCNFGRLLGSIMGLFDDVDEMTAAVENPKVAACWIGTRWTLGSITVTTRNPVTGQERSDAKKCVFTAYHGRPEGATAKPAAQKKTGGSVSKTGGSKSSKGSDDIPAELFERLVTLAREHDDEDSFQDAALELPEVEALESNDPAVFKAVQKAIMRSVIWKAK